MSKQDGRNRLVTDHPVDDVTATVLHVDMDAFFASVELLDRPDLRGLPVIVGHDSDRSVVTAATYEARRYGVNSAMPMAVARRRCPNAVIVEPHFEKYAAKSAAVMRVFGQFTPKVEKLGIDEAFLDVAGALRLYGTPWQIGTAIRAAVLAETGLHCSVGAASTKFVAKLASSRSKPDGLLVVPAEHTVAFCTPSRSRRSGASAAPRRRSSSAAASAPWGTSPTRRCRRSSPRSDPPADSACTTCPGVVTPASSTPA